MKSITKISLAVLMVLVALPTASAQPGNRPHNPSQQWNNGPHRGGGIEKILPDLTEDQLTSLKELRLDHYKK